MMLFFKLVIGEFGNFRLIFFFTIFRDTPTIIKLVEVAAGRVFRAK